MEYEDKATRVKKLYKKTAIIKGMLNEIIMSCLILKEKVENERQDKIEQQFDLMPSEELHQEVQRKMVKFGSDINKYKQRLSQIAEELKEINGTNEL